MNTAVSAVVRWGGLLLLGVAVYFFARSLPSADSGAITGLGGAVVGALIALAAQFWAGQLDRKHQLRMAAAERRLEAHQQGFALWRKLLYTIHDESKIGGVIGECQEWWNNNCLFLTSDAREKFRFAYVCAASHNDYKRDRSNPALVNENWKNITDAGEALVKGVELPTLGENEAKILPNGKP